MWIYTVLSIIGALLIIALAAAIATGRLQRWFRYFLNDTREIIEPPTKRMTVRCGKCQCKFSYTSRDVITVYRESRIDCPACKQRMRIYKATNDEDFGGTARE